MTRRSMRRSVRLPKLVYIFFTPTSTRPIHSHPSKSNQMQPIQQITQNGTNHQRKKKQKTSIIFKVATVRATKNFARQIDKLSAILDLRRLQYFVVICSILQQHTPFFLPKTRKKDEVNLNFVS